MCNNGKHNTSVAATLLAPLTLPLPTEHQPRCNCRGRPHPEADGPTLRTVERVREEHLRSHRGTLGQRAASHNSSCSERVHPVDFEATISLSTKINKQNETSNHIFRAKCELWVQATTVSSASKNFSYASAIVSAAHLRGTTLHQPNVVAVVWM